MTDPEGPHAPDAPPPTVPKGVPKGVEVIETALETMPLSPGVYRMLAANGDALYVGKARSLKKRVTSYAQLARLPERLRRMVNETVAMEIVTTHTEAAGVTRNASAIPGSAIFGSDAPSTDSITASVSVTAIWEVKVKA